MKNAYHTNRLHNWVGSSRLGKLSFACISAGLMWFIAGGANSVFAMQPQIPSLQTCNKTKVEARAKVYIGSRSDAERPGAFGIVLEAKCHPRPGYPRGKVELIELNMTDSWVHGVIVATTIDQMTSTGGHSPMAFLSGRCQVRHIGPPVVEVEPTGALTETELDDVAVAVDPNILPLPSPNPFSGCRYWIMLADNQEGDNAVGSPQDTADVVGVLVMNGRGRRIAHGAGPVVSGEVSISPSRN
ncbi:MAG: hypothetical protein VST68_13840 [Nitrospirota bacterium]|nr:hypothetical protein [Nitrospirota bacterium]